MSTAFPVPAKPSPVEAFKINARDALYGEAVSRMRQSPAVVRPEATFAKASIELIGGQDASDAVYRLEPRLLVPLTRVMHWWGPELTAPLTIPIDGVPALRIAPCDPSAEVNYYWGLQIRSAVVEAIGVEDDGSRSDVAGARAIAGTLRVQSVRVPPPYLHGEDVALAQDVADVVLAWGKAWGQGNPVAGRKRLLPACHYARPLLAEQAKREREADLAAAEARARAEELSRRETRTIGQLGLEGIAVDATEPGVTVPGALQTRRLWIWPGRPHLHLALFPAIPGLPLPPDARFAGCSVVPHDFVLSDVHPRDLENQTLAADKPIFELVCAVRRKYAPDVDRGPIGDDRWQPVGAEARALAERYARDLHASQSWRGPWLCMAIVRGTLVHPSEAAALVTSAIYSHHLAHAPVRTRSANSVPLGESDRDAALRPRISDGMRREGVGTFTVEERAPFRSATSEHDITVWCAEAKQAGEIEPGGLLPSNHSKSKKAGK
jgi:hypothetical protein